MLAMCAACRNCSHARQDLVRGPLASSPSATSLGAKRESTMMIESFAEANRDGFLRERRRGNACKVVNEERSRLGEEGIPAANRAGAGLFRLEGVPVGS